MPKLFASNAIVAIARDFLGMHYHFANFCIKIRISSISLRNSVGDLILSYGLYGIGDANDDRAYQLPVGLSVAFKI